MKILYPTEAKHRRVTQPFGDNFQWKGKPMYGEGGHITAWRYHLGIDYTSKENQYGAVKPLPIRAGMTGTLKLTTTSTKGNEATITGNGWLCNYLHLDSFEGEEREVTAGEIIGYTGNTGVYSTAAHLHMGVARTYGDGTRIKDGLDLGWINFENMLTDDLQSVIKETFPKYYKGVKVVLMNRDFKTVNGYYDEKSQEIRLYDRFFTKTPERQREILFHEFCHHIEKTVMPGKHSKFWELISTFNPTLIKALNERAGTNYTKNEYINEHLGDAMNTQDRIPSEDFAETCEYLFRHNFKYNFKGYLHIKCTLVKRLLEMNGAI